MQKGVHHVDGGPIIETTCPIQSMHPNMMNRRSLELASPSELVSRAEYEKLKAAHEDLKYKVEQILHK